jgi:hypothetical protein
MGTFKAHVKDGLSGHELLQYAVLRDFLKSVRGLDERQTRRGSSIGEIAKNPAIALTKEQHERVNREQRTLKLWDPENLGRLSPMQVIELNREALLNAKVVPPENVEILYREAVRHAEEIGAVPSTPPPPTIGGQ